MSEIRFSIHPTSFADVLHNVLVMAKDGAKINTYPHVMVRFTGPEGGEDGAGGDPGMPGQIVAIGTSRHAAGLDATTVTGGTPGGYAEVRLLAVNPDKTELVDDLTKLEASIRRVGRAADLAVVVTMRHRHSITVVYGEQLVGELADADADKSDARTIFDSIEDAVDGFKTGNRGMPSMFDLGVLARLNKLKPSTLKHADIAQHPHLDVVGVAVGPTFRGLVAGIDRNGYVKGGPWGDGPGSPAHLL